MSLTMKEKELRLAVVFFGGVSLAVYQHGINREILNLVRASKLYHSTRQNPDSAAASDAGFRGRYPDEPERSTGTVYLQCLQTIGQQETDGAGRPFIDEPAQEMLPDSLPNSQ